MDSLIGLAEIPLERVSACGHVLSQNNIRVYIQCYRRGEWEKVSPAIAVPDSDGISLLEKYHDCVKVNDIYYIASVLDPRSKPSGSKRYPMEIRLSTASGRF